MKKGYTLIELLVVISIIGFMAIYCVPAFAKFGRSSDFKQKADEVKMLMQRTYLLSRSPENTSVQAYRMIVIDQIFKLQKTDDNNSWTDVATVEKLDNNSSNLALGNDLEDIQCDIAGTSSCYVLTCPVNPTIKCNIATTAILPATTAGAITFVDSKINGVSALSTMNDMATFDFEGTLENNLSSSTKFSPNKPFNVILKFTKKT